MPNQTRCWVFDTVVISNFVFADALELLEKRYTAKAIITNEVYNELLRGMVQHPELRSIDALILKGAFELKALSMQEMAFSQQQLVFLGSGEASAIAYVQSNGGIVVTDDKAARNQCATLNIPVTGTIGILKACVQDRLLTLEDADSKLDKMVSKGFYSPVRSIRDIF